MIVVDSSALLAIFFDAPEKISLTEAIIAADSAHIGAPTLLEASIVVESRVGGSGCRELDKLVASLRLVVVALEREHVEAGRDAFRRYGKGRHRARLNFGDCCAYALAQSLGAPLLFKGDDFTQTDIKSAL